MKKKKAKKSKKDKSKNGENADDEASAELKEKVSNKKLLSAANAAMCSTIISV